MFLSKLELNPRSRRVHNEITRPYEMHRTVMSGFPQFDEQDRDRVLFRVDSNDRTRQINLLVQSGISPEWSQVQRDSQYCISDPLHKEFRPALSSGQQRYFRIRANPTVKKNGKRVGLQKEEDQQAWLSRKADLGGFEIESLSIKDEGKINDYKGTGNNSRDLSFYSVIFEGTLLVTDPDLFQLTLEKGVGPGKGIGFGLLSIAPSKND